MKIKWLLIVLQTGTSGKKKRIKKKLSFVLISLSFPCIFRFLYSSPTPCHSCHTAIRMAQGARERRWCLGGGVALCLVGGVRSVLVALVALLAVVVVPLALPRFLDGDALLDCRVVALELDPGIRREVEDALHRLSVAQVVSYAELIQKRRREGRRKRT